MRNESVIEGQVCPSCRKELDRAICLTANDCARPGDITLCFGCGAVNKFTPEMKLVEATLDDLMKVQEDKKAWSILDHAQKLIQQRKTLASP